MKNKTFWKQHFVFGQNARRESAVKEVLSRDFFDKLAESPPQWKWYQMEAHSSAGSSACTEREISRLPLRQRSSSMSAFSVPGSFSSTS